MLQWLRTRSELLRERLARGAQENVEPPPYVHIGLASIPGAILQVEGLPQPQWAIIRHEMMARFSAVDPGAFWHWAAVEWLQLLGKAFGPQFRVHESPHFLHLSANSLSVQRTLCGKAEAALRQIRYTLGSTAQKAAHGKRVIIHTEDEATYYRYISHYYAEGEHPVSGGVFLNHGYRHLVLKGGARKGWLEVALVHELTHCEASDLPLPRWLNEGIAQHMEWQLVGYRPALDRSLADRHHQFWDEETIQKFWDGSSFHKIGDSVELSYSLALILAGLLHEDFPKETIAFLSEAKFADCGQSAAQKCLGITLGELAGVFLGPGKWEPAATTMQAKQKPPIRNQQRRLILELIRAGRTNEARAIWEPLLTGEPPEMQAAILLEVACLPLHDEHCGAFLAEASALATRALELSSDPSVAREVQEALGRRAAGSGDEAALHLSACLSAGAAKFSRHGLLP